MSGTRRPLPATTAGSPVRGASRRQATSTDEPEREGSAGAAQLGVQALLVDFNGTLSQDEEIQFEIYADLCGEHGLPLARDHYLEQLVGRSDRELLSELLGSRADVGALLAERVRRYRVRTADGSTIAMQAREAIAFAARHVPVAVVTSGFREEVTPVLRAAGVDTALSAVVCADDVTHEKPSPEGYRLACTLLGVEPGHGLAVEDTDSGIAAARAAGLRCVAVTTTLPVERLGGAHEVIDELTVEQVARLLGVGAERT